MLRRELSSLAGAALAAGLLVLAGGALQWFVPFLTRERQVTSSTPAPPPLVASTPVTLAPGSRACMDQVAFDAHSEVARLRADPHGRPGPRLLLEATAPGYHARGEIAAGYRGTRRPTRAQDAAGYRPDGSLPLTARLATPSRPVIGVLCIRNAGAQPVDLEGTAEARTNARTNVTLDGQPIPVDVSITLAAARERSLLDRLGEVFDHAATFKSPLVTGWLLWPLAALLLLGVPGTVLWALAWGLRQESAGRDGRAG